MWPPTTADPLQYDMNAQPQTICRILRIIMCLVLFDLIPAAPGAPAAAPAQQEVQQQTDLAIVYLRLHPSDASKIGDFIATLEAINKIDEKDGVAITSMVVAFISAQG